MEPVGPGRFESGGFFGLRAVFLHPFHPDLFLFLCNKEKMQRPETTFIPFFHSTFSNRRYPSTFTPALARHARRHSGGQPGTAKGNRHPEIAARASLYEMAYRMQASVPELTDPSNEPKSVLKRYGPQVREHGTFAHNCLMARHMIERGVQFAQLMHAGWYQHNSLTTELYTQCADTDQPSAALVLDLKEWGPLEDTLLIWAGEFGIKN